MHMTNIKTARLYELVIAVTHPFELISQSY